MNGIVTRVREAMKARGLGNNALDRAMGKPQGFTSTLLAHADRAPRAVTLDLLARALRVRVEWLQTGQEPRDAPESDASSSNDTSHRISTPTTPIGATLEERPEWPPLVEKVRKLAPDTDVNVVAKIGKTNPLLRGPLTVQGLLDLISWYERHDPPISWPGSPR